MSATPNERTPMDVMVDIETLGTRPGCPVVTIGAVLFDPRSCDTVDGMMSRGWLWRVDLKDAVQNSNGVDADTLRWWFGQDPAAIRALVEGESVGLKTALFELSNFCQGATLPKFGGARPRATLFWAKSPDFDGKILEDSYARCSLPMPFRFFEYRCVRTVQDLAWPNGPQDRPSFAVGVAHNALVDAVSQALTVQAAYHQLGLSYETRSYSFANEATASLSSKH